MYNFHISNARFFIIRHAEAFKNLEKMHGGGTQDLTNDGIEQLLATIEVLKPVFQDRRICIFHQKEGRSEKTAKIIDQKFRIGTKVSELIYGVGLGVIANLNEDELKKLYPKVFQILENWKNNGAKLDDYPDVPGREHMTDFASRIKLGLSNMIHPNTDTILVGTTSTINMLNHLMITNGEFVHDKYDFISFPFSGVNGWQLSADKPPRKVFSSF